MARSTRKSTAVVVENDVDPNADTPEAGILIEQPEAADVNDDVANDETTEEETPKVKKPRWQPLDADTAAWVAAHARPAVSRCLCGCGESTKGRFFPGHDATLKMQLQASLQSDDEQVVANAQAAIGIFGW